MDKKEIFESFGLILLIIIVTLFFVSGCTVSLNMVGTQGEGKDVIDTEQTNEPDISPELSLSANKV